MAELPSGTVTFLFTDIEGSTRLLQELRDDYAEVLLEHQRLLRSAFEEAGGQEIDTQGDAFFFVFARGRAAVAGAEAAQRALAGHDWPQGAVVRVRMGIHSGEPTIGGNRYVGLGVHRASRICAAAHGGQVLLSNATRELIEDDLPPDLSLRDLGEQKLKDIDRSERLYQLVMSGLPVDFPPLRAPAEPAFSEREGELVAAAEAVVAEQPAGSRRPRRTRILQMGVVLAVVLAAVVVAVIASRGAGNKDAGALAPPKSVAILDPGRNAVTGSIPLDGSPSFLAGDDNDVWVANAADKTLIRVDAETQEIANTIGVGTTPLGLVAAAGSVWITSDGFGSAPLIEVVPATNDVKEAPRPRCCSGFWRVTGDDDRLWIAGYTSFDVVKFDPRSRRYGPYVCCNVLPDALALGEGALWIVERDDQQVTRIDQDTGTVETTIPIGAPRVQPLTFRRPEVQTTLAVGEGGVWVVDAIEGRVWQIDPVRNVVEGTISVGRGAKGVAVAFGSVWVANPVSGMIFRIEPSSGRIIRRIKVADQVGGIAAAGDSIWVGVP